MSNQQRQFESIEPQTLFDLDNLSFVKDALTSISELKVRTSASISEYFELKKAARLNVTAIYFKRFSGQPSVPQIYIYDFKGEDKVEETYLGELHKKIWNTGSVPLVYVFTKLEVKIFNCMKKPIEKNKKFVPNYMKQFSIEEILSGGTEIQKEIDIYLGKNFENGHFWNTANATHLKSETTVYESLKEGLMRLRDDFIKKTVSLSKESAQHLLLQCILVKYLEEREDEKGNHVFPDNYFREYDNAKNFCDVLRKSQLLNFFDDLYKNKFNGEIFHWASKDREALKNEDLSELADFLDANIENQQYVLWRLYSFEYLPVEFISSIYDEFIGNNQEGVVYTPSHLAKFLVDESMPIDEPCENYKILDPCCGSGIFLVAAFKRLVQWWHILNPEKNFNSENIQPILTNNIFGVDKSAEAVQLTIFSLSLALCDELSPKEIWFNLKFDNLKNNISSEDFFAWKKTCQIQFDLVIGNPPFIDLSKATPAAKQHLFEREGLPEIPDKHGLTLFFMEQSYELLNKKGLLCLIMPAPILLYRDNDNKDILYRNILIKNYNIAQMIDFTPLRRTLFSTSTKRDTTIAVVALFMQKNNEQQETEILHIVVRRTKAAKEKLFFELDEYDFHYVNKQIALNYPFVWKTNLLGDGRLFHIIKRLHNEFPKLETFIFQNTSSTPQSPSAGCLLIKKNIGKYGKQPAKLIKNPNTLIPPKGYDAEVIKLYSKTNDIEKLQQLKQFLNKNDIYIFYPLCISGRAATGQSFSTILKRDIYNLPYEPDKNYGFTNWEKIIVEDTLEHQLDFLRRGEDSIVLRDVEKQQLEAFGKTFCDMLNPTYQNNDYQFYQGQIIDASSFVCNTFYYGKEEGAKVLEIKKDSKSEKNIRTLIEQKHASLQINRVIRIYQKNTLYLIKPKQLRYWLRSIAIRDADKTVSDLIEMEFSCAKK